MAARRSECWAWKAPNKRGEGQAPALWVVAEFREVFLKREADVGESRAGGDGFADGFGDGVDRAVEGGFFG